MLEMVRLEGCGASADLHEFHHRDISLVAFLFVGVDGVRESIGEDTHQGQENGELHDPAGQQDHLPPFRTAKMGLVSM